MESGTTVLSVLRKARDLVSSGEQPGLIAAISALKEEASGPMRDRAYFALLDTMTGRGPVGLANLMGATKDDALALLDATISRISSKLH